MFRLLLLVSLDIVNYAHGFGCIPDQELQCMDQGTTTLCIPKAEACLLPDTNCRSRPDEEPTTNDLLWPDFAFKDTFDFHKETTASASVVRGVKEKVIQAICRFPSYLSGIKATIYHRELRTWPGEPHPVPYRPYGMTRFEPHCSDFNNSFSDGVGYYKTVPPANDSSFHEYEHGVDGNAFKVITEMQRCKKGVVTGVRVQYFDNEKAWKRAFGLRFFSEGITDIELLCEHGFESDLTAIRDKRQADPEKPEDTTDPEKSESVTADPEKLESTTENPEKDQDKDNADILKTDGKQAEKPEVVEDSIGGFTNSKKDKHKIYTDLYRESTYWTWTDVKKCGPGRAVCKLDLTMNELVGIYKVQVECCALDRDGIVPEHGEKPPHHDHPSHLPIAPPKKTCACPKKRGRK